MALAGFEFIEVVDVGSGHSTHILEIVVSSVRCDFGSRLFMYVVVIDCKIMQATGCLQGFALILVEHAKTKFI